MKTFHRALICLLALLLAVLPVAALAETAESIEAGIREIQKYGNLVLTISGNSLLEMGYEYGDIATVTIDGQTARGFVPHGTLNLFFEDDDVNG